MKVYAVRLNGKRYDVEKESGIYDSKMEAIADVNKAAEWYIERELNAGLTVYECEKEECILSCLKKIYEINIENQEE